MGPQSHIAASTPEQGSEFRRALLAWYWDKASLTQQPSWELEISKTIEKLRGHFGKHRGRLLNIQMPLIDYYYS